MSDETPNAAVPAGDAAPVSILDTFEPEFNPSHPSEAAARAPKPTEEREEEAEEASPDVDEATADDADPVATDAPEGEPDEVEAEPAPEPTPAQKKFAESDALTRLRDGREVTIAELKKLADGEEIQRRTQEIEGERQRIAQQQQFFEHTLNQAITIAEARLPPTPHPDMLHTDPIGFLQMQEARKAAIGELQNLHQARQQHHQQTTAQTEHQSRQRLLQERERLIEAFPELNDPQKAKAWTSDLVTGAKELGLTEAEVNQLGDQRYLKILKLAVDKHRLNLAKPKAIEKAKDAPPVAVQAPSRRTTSAERKSESMREDLRALKKTGDKRLAESILSRFD